MKTRRIQSKNNTAYYLIALLVIIVAFLLLGGVPWMRGMMHGSRSLGTAHWNWTQILIGTGVGFLLGLAVGRRKW